MTTFGKGFRKHQAPSRETALFPDSSLQRSDLTDGEVTGALTTESFEEFFRRPVGFGFEPGDHARPGRLEGIGARAPVPWGLGSRAMRGPDLTVSPRVCQTFQKAIEIGIAVRQHMHAFAGGEPGEVMLDGPNFIEEPQRVQCPEDGA